MTSIYVGNLPYQLAEAELREAFTRFGEVAFSGGLMKEYR